MRDFRLLRPDEIECRVQQVNSKYVKLLLYKTARTDAALLDETVGSMNWCNDYKIIDGKMYCGIGIRDKETLQWVWKWNCGVESNMEAAKGEASDALKRAGAVWGCGAELYSAPDISVPIERTTAQNGKCYDNFEVTSISYDNAQNISGLVISLNGEPVWNMATDGKKKAVKKSAPPPQPNKVDDDLPFIFHDEPGGKPTVFSGKPVCSKCGAEISDKVANYSKEKFGKYLCMKCQPKR